MMGQNHLIVTGAAICGLETLLSIGLGQNQRFHLILQSLQQLTEVYGGSVESILQSNTANLIFLKSTDAELIEKLSKMSGQRHVAYRGSKTVTKDMEDLLQFKPVEGRVSYTMALDTENVVLANDLAFLPDRDWVVLRDGQYPVWNRDETIMPMAHRLLANQPPVGVPRFAFQNLPSLSNAGSYDPRQDTPNFEAALRRVHAQALVAKTSTAEYRRAANLGEDQVRLLDPDFYAEQVMGLIQQNAAGFEPLDAAIERLREEYAAAGRLTGVGPTNSVNSTRASGSAGGAASERRVNDPPLSGVGVGGGVGSGGMDEDLSWMTGQPS
jgi:hypothetical protein